LDDNYPPYNIYTEKDVKVIEIGIAGFSEKDIKVFFDEDGYLVIEGNIEKQEREYNHRGLSLKRFKRKFTVDKFKVQNVVLKDGILKIALKEDKIEPQLIPINVDVGTIESKETKKIKEGNE
jgi:HSP20 family molecular chaperone IbpA